MIAVDVPSLFDPQIDTDRPGLARNDHPDTSHEAAAKTNTGRLRREVYDFFTRRGTYGATDDELIEAGEAVGSHANGLRPRRVELVRDGLVVDSGEKRKTRSGRNAIVWVAVADAR